MQWYSIRSSGYPTFVTRHPEGGPLSATLSYLDLAWEIGPQVVADRRYLHENPELGMAEVNTAQHSW